jgi:antitoxin component HigA of HigAB toxin-antitoxin module
MGYSGSAGNRLKEDQHASNRVSDILNRKRDLILNQIRTIGAAWHLPIEMFVAKQERERVPA